MHSQYPPLQMSSSNQLERNGWIRLPTCYLVSIGRCNNILGTYAANGNNAECKSQKREHNCSVLLIKAIDTHHHDNFGSLSGCQHMERWLITHLLQSMRVVRL